MTEVAKFHMQVLKDEREIIRVPNELNMTLWDKYQKCFDESLSYKEGMSHEDIPSSYLGKLLVYKSDDPLMLIPRAFVRITEVITYKNGNVFYWVEYIYPHRASTFHIPHPLKPSSFSFRLPSDTEIRNLQEHGLNMYSSYYMIHNWWEDIKCSHIEYKNSSGPDL